MDFGIWIYIIVFILGLSIGSFLNVLIDRLPNDKKISGRSHCDRCQKQLKWYDLIPVFSFLILRGKCQYCGEKISPQYPLVEIITGILFVFVIWILNFGFGLSFGFRILDLLTLVYFLTVISLLIVIFFSDLKYYIIPDKIIYPAMGIALIYNLQFTIFNQFSIFKNSILAAIGATSFFLALFLLSRGRWLGFGDVKLAFFMGLVLGWPNILVALFLAYILGAIIGIGLILTGRKKLKSEVPFGPFLVIGTFIAMFWGAGIIGWYFDFLR